MKKTKNGKSISEQPQYGYSLVQSLDKMAYFVAEQALRVKEEHTVKRLYTQLWCYAFNQTNDFIACDEKGKVHALNVFVDCGEFLTTQPWQVDFNNRPEKEIARLIDFIESEYGDFQTWAASYIFEHRSAMVDGRLVVYFCQDRAPKVMRFVRFLDNGRVDVDEIESAKHCNDLNLDEFARKYRFTYSGMKVEQFANGKLTINFGNNQDAAKRAQAFIDAINKKP